MKKLLIILFLIAVIIVVTFYGMTVYKNSQQLLSSGASNGNNQPKHLGNMQGGGVPQSGDPCGGTGGTGQIVNVGNNILTIKLNRDGRILKKGSNQIVDITEQTEIKTSSGSGSVSDLKTGDNVTIGGKLIMDNSLVASIVVVCSN